MPVGVIAPFGTPCHAVLYILDKAVGAKPGTGSSLNIFNTSEPIKEKLGICMLFNEHTKIITVNIVVNNVVLVKSNEHPQVR